MKFSRLSKKATTLAVAGMIPLICTPALASSSGKHHPRNYHKKLVVSSNDTVDVKLSGQVNQVAMFVNDGTRDTTFYGNNQVSTTRFLVTGTAHVDHDTDIVGLTEIGVKNSSSDVVSQTARIQQSLDIRKAEFYVNSKTWGRLSLGKGDTASNNSAHVDLSGTSSAVYAGIQDLGGGLFYRNKATGVLSAITVGGTINDLDGLTRRGRIRYDTPTFWGMQLSGSVVQNAQNDVALTNNQQFSWGQFASAIAYTHQTAFMGTVAGNGVDGSTSVLFNNGLNATFAGGEVFADPAGRLNPHYFYTKLGYIAQWFSPGKTAIAADYGRFKHYAANNDKATEYGAIVLQNISNWNSAVYFGWRHIGLTRAGSSFYPINMGIAGAMIKF